MSEDKKSCFIIMPLTTPETHLKVYRDGADHFEHVLNSLHVPAVEKARFEPILPSAQGADLIHAEIIQNLERADLVLCDISCHNPNVFFELGMRTALNKPVCFVKDELTKKAPFDTDILNRLEYKSSLDAWDRDDQIKLIADHIKESFDRSDRQNALWRYFGIKTKARAYEMKEGTEGKLDEILFRMNTLEEKVESNLYESANYDPISKDIADAAIHYLKSELPEGIEIKATRNQLNSFRVTISDYLKEEDWDRIKEGIKIFGFNCVLRGKTIDCRSGQINFNLSKRLTP